MTDDEGKKESRKKLKKWLLEAFLKWTKGEATFPEFFSLLCKYRRYAERKGLL